MGRKKKDLTEAEILDIEASYAETGQDVDWTKMEKRSKGTKSKTTLVLKLRVDYDLNGESLDDMEWRLNDAVNHAINHGLLTGGSMAEVSNYTVEITKK